MSLAGSHGSVCAAHADQYAAAREDHDRGARPDASCGDRRSARDRCSGHRVPGVRGAARRSLRIGAAQTATESATSSAPAGAEAQTPLPAPPALEPTVSSTPSVPPPPAAPPAPATPPVARGSENSVRRRNWFGSGGDWRRSDGVAPCQALRQAREACWTGNEHRRLARRLADRRTRDRSCDERRRHHTAAGSSSCP